MWFARSVGHTSHFPAKSLREWLSAHRRRDVEAKEAVETLVKYCSELEHCKECEIKDICTNHFVRKPFAMAGLPKHWKFSKKRRKK